MKRGFVYKVLSALLLVAMLASFGPGSRVQADDPPPGLGLDQDDKQEIARQVKEAGADEVFFPEARGGELVIGIRQDGKTHYLVAREETVDQNQLKEDLPEAGSPSSIPECPPQGKHLSFNSSGRACMSEPNVTRAPSETGQARMLKFAFIDEETFKESLAVPEEQSGLKRVLTAAFGARPAFAQTYFWHGSYVIAYPSSSYWATAPLYLSPVDADKIGDVGASAIAAVAAIVAVLFPPAAPAAAVVVAILEGVWFAGFWCYMDDNGAMTIYIPWDVMWGGAGCVWFADSVCVWYCT